MPPNTFVHVWTILSALNRPGDDCRVVIEGTDEWVFAQELQRLLLLGSSSDQLPQRAEPIALV